MTLYSKAKTEFSSVFRDRPNILGSIMEVVENIFGNMEEPVTRDYETPEELMKAMSECFGLKIKRIKKNKISALQRAATQYFCYQCKLMFNKKCTMTEVGKTIGCDYHHTSVLHSIQTCIDRLETREAVMVLLHEKWVVFNSEK